MNSGRPPYGNTPVWNQQNQAGQQNHVPGGYPPAQAAYGQQPVYGQQPANGGYPQGYPQQSAYGQQPGYQPQTGYAPQQTAYPPQQGHAPQQAAYPPQGAQPVYGQQPGYQPQPTGYAQQPAGYAQPRQQTYQQNYPPTYPQGQQQAASQMYPGYQPPRRKNKIPPETIALMVIGGVLPVLFILGMVLPGAAWLKWVFVVLTVVSIAYVWARNAVKGNLKLTLSLIYGALAVIALVSALTSAAPADNQNQNSLGGGVNASQQGNQNNPAGGGSIQDNDLVWHESSEPTAEPTNHPAISEGEARKQLESFFYFWSVNGIDNLVNLTPPSWQSSVKEPKTALFAILVNRTPIDYTITNLTGTEADTSRTATVRATISNNNGRNPEVYLYTVVLSKENGIWYVDPRSLQSNERETSTPETGGNTTPTQPPVNTSYPGMTCYYNPDGGKYYHIDPECSSAAASNLPFKGSFDWSQVDQEPYSKLEACATCGAPMRGE